jgi:hypothetical protein
MPIRIKIVALAISIPMICLIIELVRRRKLREEYSQLWFATWIVILGLMIWFDLLKWISHLIGAYSDISTIFFLALLFLILICLHFSVVISKLTNQIKELGQQHALLKIELDEARERVSEGRPNPSS